MKVFHIRLDSPHYNSDGIKRAFESAGYQYSGFDWMAYRFDRGLQAVRMEIIRRAEIERPDLILAHIQNPEVFDVDTAKVLSTYGFVVNFTFDVRSKERTQWMYDIAPHIGLTAFACDEDVQHCRGLGINNAILLKSSCDTEVYKPMLLPESLTRSMPEIVFIGNNNVNTNLGFEQAQQRVDMVKFLQQTYGKRFGLYGLGWPGTKMVGAIEEVNLYSGCKVAITQNQYNRKGYCSDRQWRAIASGAMTVCQYYDGLEDDFDDSEMFSWIDFDDLKDTIDFFLSKETERELVSLGQGHRFFERHTWESRVAQLKQAILAIGIK